MKQRRSIFATLGAASLALTSCGGSQGLEPRYVAVHNAMSAVGLAQTGPISEGSLGEGDEARFEMELEANQCYTFVALASGGVEDVNIRVVQEGDEELGHDQTHDRQAALQVCATRSGAHQVVVSMAEGSGGYVLSTYGGMVAGSAGMSSGPSMNGGQAGTCGSPIDIAFGEPMTGDTTQATNTIDPPCAGNGAPEQFYRFEVPERMRVTIELSSSYDGALVLMRQCGNLGDMLDCNDDHMDTAHSRIDTTLDPGTYYFAVDGYADSRGAYTVQVNASQLRPIADICAQAPALVPGQPVSGSTDGEQDSFQGTCAGGTRSADVVYRLPVAQRSRVRVFQQSDHDGALYLRSDCANSASEIACNDDFVSTSQSVITAVVDPGDYFVYTDGYGSGSQGRYTMTADVAPIGQGSSQADSCSAPGAMAPNQMVQVDTMRANDDYAGSCGGQGAPDQVFNFSVQSRSRVDISLANVQFEGVVYLQRTCGDASTEIVCLPMMGNNTVSAVVDPGQYSVVFDGQQATSFGALEATMTTTDLAALTRDCRQAPMIRPGQTVNGETRSTTDRFQASCGGRTRSNDRVYRLRLRRRSRVVMNLNGDYDCSLHIRSDCADGATEVACNDDTNGASHSMIDTTLDRGTYYVIVDGYGAGSAGSFSLTTDVYRPGQGPAVVAPQPPRPAGGFPPGMQPGQPQPFPVP